MSRRGCVIALLVICTCSTHAIHKNYGRILARPEFKEVLGLFAPEKILVNYKDTLADHAGDEALLNPSCRRELMILNGAIARGETWALTMLDASSKPPSSGLLRGNIVDLGQYDECSAVRSDSSASGIRGLPCTYSISVTHEDVTLPVSPTLSVCVPATCSADDVVGFFNATAFSRLKQLKDLRVELTSAACSIVDRPVWDLELVVYLISLGSLVAFLIACTIIDVSRKRLEDGESRPPIVDTLAMFSLRKSAASILSMEVKKGTIPALDGIRCLSMLGVVLFHQFIVSPQGAMINTLDFYEWSRTWRSFYICASFFTVDTFFAISGFLMTYLFLKQMPKQKKFNVLMYYCHRYLRLTPAVLALMVFTIVLMPKLGSGARWDAQLSPWFDGCRTKWWPTLFYLQNFVDKENLCWVHLWYLAVDMQFFWVSPLILYPLYKKPKFGLILLAALLLSSLTVSATIIGSGQIRASSLYHNIDTSDFTTQIQVLLEVNSMPYHRIGPWLVGIFLGYEVAMHNRKLSRRSAAVGWSIAIASFAFSIFGKIFFFDPDYEYNVVWDTFFSSVSRTTWAIGACWIIYACTKNQAGMLSRILSLKIFQPLSKLSYGIYLVHLLLQASDNAALKSPRYFSEYHLWCSFFHTLIISTALAFLLRLFFESPILVLEKILKRKAESQTQKNHTNKSTHSENEKCEPKPVLTHTPMTDRCTALVPTDHRLDVINSS